MISAVVAGFVAGAVHVLAGPDHLAAIAPLAAHGRNRTWRMGLRWGVGHAGGIAIVALVALALREVLPAWWLSSAGERLVGVVLIGIGLWALRRVFSIRVHTHEHVHDDSRHVHIHVHSTRTAHHVSHARSHTHAALGIGLLHGLAGSAHVLAILPALALPSTRAAIGYLTGFAVGTIVAMVVFAALIGALAARFITVADRVYRALLGACGVIAIAVGTLWVMP